MDELFGRPLHAKIASIGMWLLAGGFLASAAAYFARYPDAFQNGSPVLAASTPDPSFLLARLADLWVAVEAAFVGWAFYAGAPQRRAPWMVAAFGASIMAAPLAELVSGVTLQSWDFLTLAAGVVAISCTVLWAWGLPGIRTWIPSLAGFAALVMGAGVTWLYAHVLGQRVLGQEIEMGAGQSTWIRLLCGGILIPVGLAFGAWAWHLSARMQRSQPWAMAATLAVGAGSTVQGLLWAAQSLNFIGTSPEFGYGFRGLRETLPWLILANGLLFAAAAVAACIYWSARPEARREGALAGIGQNWSWIILAVPFYVFFSSWFGLTRDLLWRDFGEGADVFGRIWGNGGLADAMFALGSAAVAVGVLAGAAWAKQNFTRGAALAFHTGLAGASMLANWIVYTLSFVMLPDVGRGSQSPELMQAFAFTWGWGFPGLLVVAVLPLLVHGVLALRDSASPSEPAATALATTSGASAGQTSARQPSARLPPVLASTTSSAPLPRALRGFVKTKDP